jgi:hypothetical protein
MSSCRDGAAIPMTVVLMYQTYGFDGRTIVLLLDEETLRVNQRSAAAKIDSHWEISLATRLHNTLQSTIKHFAKQLL